jgi:hypothetical protein
MKTLCANSKGKIEGFPFHILWQYKSSCYIESYIDVFYNPDEKKKYEKKKVESYFLIMKL